MMEIAIRDDNGTNTFRPGSSIEGKVFFFELDKLEIRNISVKLVRRFYASNSILRNGSGSTGRALLKEEVIIGQEISIPDQSFLEAGVPFTLTTRKDMQRSYATDVIELKYFISATAVARKSLLGSIITADSVIKKECDINIYAPICASAFPAASKPSRSSELRSFKKGLFRKDGDIEGTAVLGKSIFTFGENIPLMVTAQNKTSEVRVNKIVVSLAEVTTFSGKHEAALITQNTGITTSFDLLDGAGLPPQTSRTLKGDLMVPMPDKGFHPTLVESPGVDFCVNHYLGVLLLDEFEKPLLTVSSRIFIVDTYFEAPPSTPSVVSTSPSPASTPSQVHEHCQNQDQEVPPPRPPKPSSLMGKKEETKEPEKLQDSQEQKETKESKSDSAGGSGDDSGLCVVCLSEPQTHIVVPCGHKCLCETCAQAVQKMGKCPICQSPLQTIIRVFEA